ncbi:MAG: hypothetical protein LBE13_16305 [Bacteroidales bacterium]|jgi:hypothetical protein|nr:hypothetical protein [Bacteroidales bacterium]
MKKAILFFFFVFSTCTLKAQVFQLSGYLKKMHSFYFLQHEIPLPNGDSTKFTYYNLFHNRLNFTIRPFRGFQIDVGMRNRLLDGALIREIPQYANILSLDDGIVDLNWNIIHTGGWLFNTSFDRFVLDYSWKRFQIKIGRQRINWGINLVWNPNDIFNAFSYMDFDYEERPGSDAVSFTWYSSSFSSLDAVFKIDKDSMTTLAVRYLFNVKRYDIQVTGGKNEKDIVIGGGWSGNIKNVSFRGEASFFVSVFDKNDRGKTALSATVSADYTFDNSLYLHGAFLFNSMGTTKKEGGISLLGSSLNLSAKQLSIGMYELFGQISYPVLPILSLDLVGMFNPADLSVYCSSGTTISLHNNIELLLHGQFLFGKQGSEYGANGNTYVASCRLRWSF